MTLPSLPATCRTCHPTPHAESRASARGPAGPQRPGPADPPMEPRHDSNTEQAPNLIAPPPRARLRAAGPTIRLVFLTRMSGALERTLHSKLIELAARAHVRDRDCPPPLAPGPARAPPAGMKRVFVPAQPGLLATCSRH